MGYRYPTSRCRSLPELEDRVRELVRQLEPVVLENVPIGTSETVISHGLGETPGWVGPDFPHCRALIEQTRPPDRKRIYLRASNDCVVNILLKRANPGALTSSVLNGGFTSPPPPWGGAIDDHLVKASNTDATAVGGLSEKTEGAGSTTLSVVTTGGVNKLRISSPGLVTESADGLAPQLSGDPTEFLNGEGDWVAPTPPSTGDHKVSTDATDEAATGYDYLLAKHANTGNVTFSLDTTDGMRRVAANVDTSSPLAWRTAYSCNFATLANAVLADGPNTIAGKSWQVCNSDNAAVSSVNPDGDGTRFLVLPMKTWDYSVVQDAPGMSISLAELLGMTNPELKVDRVRIWVQHDWVEPMTAAGEHQSVMVGYTQHATGLLDKFSWRVRSRSGYVDGTHFRQHEQWVSLPNTHGDETAPWDVQAPQPATRYDVTMFEWWPNSMTIQSYYGIYNAGWPSLNSLLWGGKTVAGTSEWVQNIEGIVYTASRYPFFGLCAASEDSTAGVANILLEKLLVQYQVAATSDSPSTPRPTRSVASVSSNIVTVPLRAEMGTLSIGGAVVLDGVNITASQLEDGDEFELLLSGTGTVVINHNTGSLPAGCVPFFTPGSAGGDPEGIGITLAGSTTLRRVVFRYLSAEGYALVCS